MNKSAHVIIIRSILVAWLSIPCVVEAAQLIKLSTASATFQVGINNDNGHALSPYEQFKFESSMSKLFHTKLSGYYAASRDIDFSRSRVVATSVHVQRTMLLTNTSTEIVTKKDNNSAAVNSTTTKENNDNASTSSSSVSLLSIVSVTFSDVGLYKALKVAPITGGLEAKVAPDVAAHLTEIVSSADVVRVLMDEQLMTNYDNSTEIELSFGKFDGPTEERGMTATETEILSSGKINDGWPMFFAGMMFAFLMVSIVIVAAWIYKQEFPFVLSDGDRRGNTEEDAACKSVHYKQGDSDDVATTASGILGTKGMHPRATLEENDENAHPNNGGGSAYRRKKRYHYGNSSPSSQTEDDTENGSARDDNGCCSPRTPSSGVATSSRRFPLGITSMRRLDSIRTPQKLESDRRPMYDLDRLTKS